MGHGLRRVAAQCGGLRAMDDQMEVQYDAQGRKVHSKKLKRHGKQPYGYPDLTDWMNKHPGTTEWSCEFCGIYTASISRCNRCESDE